jgi:hypothetical protein
MKITLSMKLSGICGSGIFILTAIPGYFQLIRPTDFTALASEPVSGITLLENLIFSLGGACVGGILGFFMGKIMESPQGTPKTTSEGGLKASKGAKPIAGDAITGDETFLSDLEGYTPTLTDGENETAEAGDNTEPGEAVVLTEYAEEPSQT